MDLFIHNLEVAMLQDRFSTQTKVANASGVSQAHVGNLLRKEKVPTIDIVQQIAHGLGLRTWQILLPARQFKKGITNDFNDLLESYLAATPKGRDTILSVAEAQASHNPASQDKKS